MQVPAATGYQSKDPAASSAPVSASSAPVAPAPAAIDYSRYAGHSPLAAYTWNPNGLPSNWSWDEWLRVQPEGTKDPRMFSASGEASPPAMWTGRQTDTTLPGGAWTSNQTSPAGTPPPGTAPTGTAPTGVPPPGYSPAPPTTTTSPPPANPRADTTQPLYGDPATSMAKTGADVAPAAPVSPSGGLPSLAASFNPMFTAGGTLAAKPSVVQPAGQGRNRVGNAMFKRFNPRFWSY